jgi:spermidine synthase
MTFTIDTGTADRPISFGFGNSALLDGAIDALPENATQAQIDSKVVEMIMGDLRKPKTLKTVRQRLLVHWHLIAPLAEREPDQFDAILLEYLDRQQTLAE